MPGEAGRDGRVAGLVLAAGSSSRMGVEKLALEIAGRSLLRRAVDAALGAGLDPVVVVTRPGAAVPRPEEIRIVESPESARGPGASIRAGLAALGGELAAVTVLLADMPFVDASLVARLVAAWRRSACAIAAATADRTPVPPVVFGRGTLTELAAVPPEAGGRGVLAARPERVEMVPVPRLRLADVDRPADLERFGVRLVAPRPA